MTDYEFPVKAEWLWADREGKEEGTECVTLVISL